MRGHGAFYPAVILGGYGGRGRFLADLPRMQSDSKNAPAPAPVEAGARATTAAAEAQRPARDTPREIGGPQGPEPTRYGDWERKGRCIDF
jgi:hypothetical protein